MTIRFELPSQIEQRLREQFSDVDGAAKEAAVVELYRRRRLTHHELTMALGLSRFEADALLKRHAAEADVTLDELNGESAAWRAGNQ